MEIERIAQIIGQNSKGGVESVVFNYYKFIDKSKFQFDFFVQSNSPYEIPVDILKLGCNVIIIPPYKHLFAYIMSLNIFFKKGQYKIVHSNMSTISVFVLLAAKLANIPVRISHNHVTAGKGRGEFFRNMIKYILRPFSKVFPTHLFACSEYAGRWMYGNKTFDKGKVTVINNAIDISKFAYNENIRNSLRNDLNLNGKFVVGNVGRFMPQKNHDFLIDIFYEVYKKDSDSVLLLIGEGELKKRIKEKTARLGMKNNVLFIGIKENVHEYYQVMDVFVLPSLYEGLGMVAVESQVSGLPSVVSDKVPYEAKLDNFIDFISLKQKPAAWAEIILSKRNFKRLYMSKKECVKRFSIAEESKKLEKIYEQMIS